MLGIIHCTLEKMCKDLRTANIRVNRKVSRPQKKCFNRSMQHSIYEDGNWFFRMMIMMMVIEKEREKPISGKMMGFGSAQPLIESRTRCSQHISIYQFEIHDSYLYKFSRIEETMTLNYEIMFGI